MSTINNNIESHQFKTIYEALSDPEGFAKEVKRISIYIIQSGRNPYQIDPQTIAGIFAKNVVINPYHKSKKCDFGLGCTQIVTCRFHHPNEPDVNLESALRILNIFQKFSRFRRLKAIRSTQITPTSAEPPIRHEERESRFPKRENPSSWHPPLTSPRISDDTASHRHPPLKNNHIHSRKAFARPPIPHEREESRFPKREKPSSWHPPLTFSSQTSDDVTSRRCHIDEHTQAPKITGNNRSKASNENVDHSNITTHIAEECAEFVLSET